MTVNELLTIMASHSSALCVILIIGASLIEIVPIKINPMSAFFKWIGDKCSKPIEEKMEQNRLENLKIYSELKSDVDVIKDELIGVKKNQDTLKDENELTKAMTSRYRIIRAADEIRNGNELSDEHVEQLGEDIEIYDKYCNEHPNYHNHKGQKSKALVLSYEDQKIVNKLIN